MNQIIKELKETKQYTSDCMRDINKYVNDFASAVVSDLKDIAENLNKINERLDKLEAKVNKTPKTKKKTEPKIEYAVGEEVMPTGIDVNKIMEDNDNE